LIQNRLTAHTFEFLKESMLPDLTKWESHLISIVLVGSLSTLAVVVLSRALRAPKPQHLLPMRWAIAD
jgi:hypothetical protein